jgi:hypothetical protein
LWEEFGKVLICGLGLEKPIILYVELNGRFWWEDQKANWKADSEGQAQGISDRIKDSIRNLTKSHVCSILVKDLLIFCLCPETLWEAEFNGNGLIKLVEEISRQASIYSVTWLLLAAFRQVYSENWEQKAEQKDLKNSQFVQESQCKDGGKECMISEEISTIEKKPTTFPG